MHNEASLSSGLNSQKAMYHQYMISRAFIPPWSLVMRDRKLSDQTLPSKESRNPSFPFTAILRPCRTKVTKLASPQPANSSVRNMVVPVRFLKVRMTRNRSIIAPGIQANIRSTRRLLPLCFRRQALASPFAIPKRIRPIHTGGGLLSLLLPFMCLTSYSLPS